MLAAMPSPDPARILRQHLQTDALLGASAVPTPAGVNRKPISDPSTTTPTQIQPRRTSPATPRQHASFTLTPPATAEDRGKAPPLPPVHPAATKLITGLKTQDKVAQLQQLATEFEQDPRVQALRPPGTNLVFGEGDVDAKLMFIGEGPGETEDRLGRPFVGKAGELLDRMITAMGLEREQVYIANVVKYRPPGNRTPTPEEAAVQGVYLARQVAIIHPTALVALGGAAAKFALQTTTGITRLRGQWAQFTHTDPPLPIMPTFHPAYLLRSYTADNRKKVWADLQDVLRSLQSPEDNA